MVRGSHLKLYSAGCLSLALVWLSHNSAAISFAQEPAKNGAEVTPSQGQIVSTYQQARVGQQVLRYTATAGLLPIRNNETGEIHGNMFFVAYTLDRLPTEAKRPLMFLWNGGPGANSTLVHLSGFGPKRIKSNDDPTAPRDCECEMEDNQTTWLEFTDLIFV